MNSEQTKKRQKIAVQVEALLGHIGVYDTFMSLGCSLSFIFFAIAFLAAWLAFDKTVLSALGGGIGIAIMSGLPFVFLAETVQRWVIRRIALKFNQSFPVDTAWEDRELAINELRR